MDIRRADLKDVEKILSLDRKWKREGVSWGIVVSSQKERKKQIKKNIVYIAEDRGKTIAYIEGEVIKSERKRPAYEIKKGEKYGELHSIYIINKYRREGLGKKMVENLLKEFKKNKVKKVLLKAVNKDLSRLVKFYKKFGFKERIVDMVKEMK